MNGPEGGSRQSFNISGDNVQIGSVNQTIQYGSGPQPAEVYEFGKVRSTPLTAGSLSLIGTVAALLGLIPAYATFEPVGSFVADGSKGTFPGFSVLGFLAIALLAGVAITAWRLRAIVKFRLLRLSRWFLLPAATTKEGRLVFANLRGTCPKCGNRLRFRSRPAAWIERPGLLGFSKRQIIEREQVAQCVASSGHVWKIDPAENRQDR